MLDLEMIPKVSMSPLEAVLDLPDGFIRIYSGKENMVCSHESNVGY